MTRIYTKSEKELEDIFIEMILDLDTDRQLKFDDLHFNAPKSDKYSDHKMEVYRQVGLGVYGILDVLVVVEFSNPINNDEHTEPIYYAAHIIELKNVPVQTEDLEQASRYLQAIRNLDRFHYTKAHLIGPDIKSGFFTAKFSLLLEMYEVSFTYTGMNIRSGRTLDYLKKFTNEDYESTLGLPLNIKEDESF